MPRRINVMIDDEMWQVLAKIPAGARSRAINEALRAWIVRRRRNDAVRELDALRSQSPPVSASEVAEWVRQERDEGH
jgi:hypothetical protein